MKKVLIAGFIALCAAGTWTVLNSNAPAPATSPCIGGDYADGTLYPVKATATHTVVGTAVDTFRMTSSCNPKYISFGNVITKIGGSPTVTLACYRSINGGTSYATTPIITATVTPTTTTTTIHDLSAPAPATNYMWALAGSASSTISWYSNALAQQ